MMYKNTKTTEECEEIENVNIENEYELQNDYESEEEFDYIAQTKPIGRLIFLVAFTAIMLISSTYAWFSAQKNVSINGIEGTVNVAEGLMISLDAKNWSQEIDLKNPVLDTGNTLDVPYSASADGTSYTAGKNNRPIEMLPVSATGVEDIGVNKEMSFYEGTNINGTELYGIKKTKAHVSESATGSADEQYAGFFAIDMFLQNSSKVTESEQGTAKETLQLNTNSLLRLLSTGSAETTGLQNTARVALAMYDITGLTNKASTVGTDTSSIYVTANQSQILTAYEGKKISDIAIWEPNASTHVENIVTNNNTLKLNTTDDALYTATTADATTKISKFTGTEVVPTYALTATSVSAVQELRDFDATTNADKKGILDIYNWNITDTNTDKRDDATGLSKQIALQTDTETGYTIQEGGVRNLVSVTSPGTTIYEMGNESGVIKFEMLKNSIIKLRMYVWLEGQDVDCTNYASHGGGVRVDLGLVKGAEVGSAGESVGDNTTWVSPSEIFDADGTNIDGLHIGDFVNYDAGTWTVDEISAIQTGEIGNLVTANGSANLPAQGFQFGGFTAGSSRNGNATSYNTTYNYVKDASTGSALTGWRVFDVDGDDVTLISAGNPEDYYHAYGTGYAYMSEYILTGNVNSSWSAEEAANYQKRSWSNYINTAQKATSATVLTKSKLDNWYSKYMGIASADTWDDTTFRQIYAEPYLNYQSIVDNYSYYWLSAATYSSNVYNVYPYDRYVGNYSNSAFGVRVLVSLSSDIQFTETKTGTKTLTGANMTSFGGDQTYNCWEIQ